MIIAAVYFLLATITPLTNFDTVYSRVGFFTLLGKISIFYFYFYFYLIKFVIFSFIFPFHFVATGVFWWINIFKIVGLGVRCAASSYEWHKDGWRHRLITLCRGKGVSLFVRYNTIQYNKYNKNICNTRMVSRSRIWGAGSRQGEDVEASLTGLTECTEKIVCLEIPLKRGKRRAVANFKRKPIPYWRCCITEASTAYDGRNCSLWKEVFLLRTKSTARSVRNE